MAIAAGQIAWGLSASPQGFSSSGQGLDYAVDNLQWVSNYLGLCGTNATYFVAQVGKKSSSGCFRRNVSPACLFTSHVNKQLSCW